MDQVRSKLFDVGSIIQGGYRYNIPRYQRLYVWETEQVKTFFNDIYTAWVSKKALYYIGGIITAKYSKIENGFDLVDGQQRFTTLWLLANELGSDIKAFTHTQDGLRLNFSIRQNVTEYFNQLMVKTDVENKDAEFDDLVRISKARKTIQSLITEYIKDEHQKNQFVSFIIHKVKMVITEVPISTDLNKLFETLNNRGEQLAHHEILKAQLLSKIKNKKTRYRYSILWNACSDMNNYIERCLTYEIGNAREIANSYNQWTHDWVKIENTLKEDKVSADNLSLRDIIRKRKIWEDTKEEAGGISEFNEIHEKASDDELEPVRSILTFPQLLLHTLRIFLFQKNSHDAERAVEDIQRINEKELLSIFAKHLFISEYDDMISKTKAEEKESLALINLLFKVREAFDKYVIKWVKESEDNETHLIKKVYKQNQKKGGWSYYLRRLKTQEFEGLALLQSILYHSQQNTTQYWLTPFLYRMLDFPGFDSAYLKLKKLDNILFSSQQEHRNLSERTWECIQDFPSISPTSAILREGLGTDFPHYWFYKMDFILWHAREQLGKKEEWKNYKMTAKNSIEHISPQNPRDSKDKLCNSQLNHFGNLVLVTRSINSEYSDLPYGVKKAKFDDKKSKGSLDSLKSDIVYAHSNWDDHLAAAHQDYMITLMESYFQQTSVDS